MKRFLSIMLVVMMLVSSISISAYALPYDQCLKLDDPDVTSNGSGYYAYFKDVSMSANNTHISFDMSWEADGNGQPKLSINAGDIEMRPTSVKVHGVSANISWNDVSLSHWKRVDIYYENGTCTFVLCGQEIVSVSASCRTSGLVFTGWPGTIYIDNVDVVCGSNTALFLNFEDEWEYVSHKGDDFTPVRTSVPSDSYYDDAEPIADTVKYVFNSAKACEKLLVESAGETYWQGDVNADGNVTVKDSRLLQKVMLGTENQEDYPRADINGDGDVTVKDSRLLQKIMLGLEDPVEVTTGTSSATAGFNIMAQAAELTSVSTSADGVDAQLVLDEALDPTKFEYAVITYMTPNKTDDKNSDAAVQSAFGDGTNFVTYGLNTDGYYHSQAIQLSNLTSWDGTSVVLRFFVAANEGDRIFIDSVCFCANETRKDTAVSERATATKTINWVDNDTPTPDPVECDLGYFDDNGNYVILFNNQDKITSKITASNNSTFSYDSTTDSLKATVTSSADPSVYVDLSSAELSAGTYGYLTYTYMIPTTIQREGPSCNFYYVCGNIDVPTGGYESDLINAKKTGYFCSITIALNAKSNWSGLIKGLRMDYFTDAPAGDCVYIDSIIFSTSQQAGEFAGSARMVAKNGEPPVEELTACGIWNNYRTYHQNADPNEFIVGSGSGLQMYFRYGSASKLTERSLADRFARAITNATGYEVSAKIDVHTNFDLLSDGSQHGIYFTLKYEGWSYIVYIPVTIIFDSSYTNDPLDGTSDDPVYVTPNNGTWFSEGFNVTDSVKQATANTSLISHSNHECRIVETPYGTFAAYATYANSSTWGTIGGANFTIFKIEDNGSYKKIKSYDFAYHTTKPNIFYAADGNIYVVCADDQGSSWSMFVGYFDPSKPNSDGSYNITSGRTSIGYPGGGCPGGYGYAQPILDDNNGKIYVMSCGGSTSGYLAWAIYDYRTHKWESTTYSTTIDGSYRHCYLYAYPDGANGIYVVGGRDVLLSTLGYDGLFTSVQYAWDEVNLFHFPNIRSTNYTFQHITEADYTQTDRNLFPGSQNNNGGDTYITEDGYMHVIASYGMHNPPTCSGVFYMMWHAVYDVRGAGAEPTLLYREPIYFISPDNIYTVRFAENTSGHLFILAIPKNKGPRLEIWSATDNLGTQFELVGCKNFSDSMLCCSGMLATGSSRNGSIRDNTVGVLYPVDPGDWTNYYYRYCNVTLPD